MSCTSPTLSKKLTSFITGAKPKYIIDYVSGQSKTSPTKLCEDDEPNSYGLKRTCEAESNIKMDNKKHNRTRYYNQSFLDNCCICDKRGGSINLTKDQAKQLIKQMGGNSIKSTYITYNGNNAKILGYNRYMREFIVQSNNGLENISVKKLLVNGKSVL